MSHLHSKTVEAFSHEIGLAPSSIDDRTNTAIFKKTDLRKVLNISFSGSFFDFIENDAAIDKLIADFAAFVRKFEAKGVRVFTRKPIGSGFLIEIRVAEMASLVEFLREQRVKRAMIDVISEIEQWGAFSVLSLSGATLVGCFHEVIDDRVGFARYCLERFPQLEGHFNDAEPKRVDPVPLIAQELKKSQTFFLKW